MLIHSPFGQSASKASRKTNLVAISLGYDTHRHKLLAFVFVGGDCRPGRLVEDVGLEALPHCLMCTGRHQGQVILMNLVGGLEATTITSGGVGRGRLAGEQDWWAGNCLAMMTSVEWFKTLG